MEEYGHWIIGAVIFISAIITIVAILVIGKRVLKDVEYIERKRVDPKTKEEITERIRGKEKDRAIFKRNAFFYLAFLFAGFLFVAAGWPIWRLIFLWRSVVFAVFIITAVVAVIIGLYGTFPLGFGLYNPDRRLGCFIYIAKHGEFAAWLFNYYRDSLGRLSISTNTIGKAIYHVILGKKNIVETTGVRQNTPQGQISVNDQELTFDMFLLERLGIKAKETLEEDESEHSVIAALREYVGLELEMAYIYADSTLDKHWLKKVEGSIKVLRDKVKRLQEEKAEILNNAPDILLESILRFLSDVDIELGTLSLEEISLKMNEALKKSSDLLELKEKPKEVTTP